MRWLRTFAAWPSSSRYAESSVFHPFSVRFPPVFRPFSIRPLPRFVFSLGRCWRSLTARGLGSLFAFARGIANWQCPPIQPVQTGAGDFKMERQAFLIP